MPHDGPHGESQVPSSQDPLRDWARVAASRALPIAGCALIAGAVVACALLGAWIGGEMGALERAVDASVSSDSWLRNALAQRWGAEAVEKVAAGAVALFGAAVAGTTWSKLLLRTLGHVGRAVLLPVRGGEATEIGIACFLSATLAWAASWGAVLVGGVASAAPRFETVVTSHVVLHPVPIPMPSPPVTQNQVRLEVTGTAPFRIFVPFDEGGGWTGDCTFDDTCDANDRFSSGADLGVWGEYVDDIARSLAECCQVAGKPIVLRVRGMSSSSETCDATRTIRDCNLRIANKRACLVWQRLKNALRQSTCVDVGSGPILWRSTAEMEARREFADKGGDGSYLGDLALFNRRAEISIHSLDACRPQWGDADGALVWMPSPPYPRGQGQAAVTTIPTTLPQRGPIVR